MTEVAAKTGVDLVQCAVCLKEIPKSAARCAEVDDYVVHFCGLACYEEWAEEERKERTQEAGEP